MSWNSKHAAFALSLFETDEPVELRFTPEALLALLVILNEAAIQDADGRRLYFDAESGVLRAVVYQDGVADELQQQAGAI